MLESTHGVGTRADLSRIHAAGVASNTIIQTIVEDEKRGRVMSFYMMAFLGTAPFGSLIAGSMSEQIGPAHTLQVAGGASDLREAWHSA